MLSGRNRQGGSGVPGVPLPPYSCLSPVKRFESARGGVHFDLPVGVAFCQEIDLCRVVDGTAEEQADPHRTVVSQQRITL